MIELAGELDQHPLAGFNFVMTMAATAYVLTIDLSHPAVNLDGVEFSNLLKQVQRILGSEWLAIRIGSRVWLLHPPGDDLIVIGPGFVATDSTHDPILDRFAAVIQAMHLESLLFTKSGVIRDKIQAALAERTPGDRHSEGDIRSVRKLAI